LEFANEIGGATEHEWRGDGVPAELLDESETRIAEPSLAPNLGPAYHLPTLAQLRNPRHLQALKLACERTARVCVQEDAETRIRMPRAGRVEEVETSAGPVAGDVFVIAAGAWTDELLQPLGWRTRIQPVRGQIALLNPGRPLFRRVLIAGARYLVPRLDGRVLVGSTEEHAGFEKHNTTEGIEGLLQLAIKLVPALATATLERCWAGLRPGSPDGLPFIGKVPGLDNVFVASGHFRAGIQLSPGTALLLKEMILGNPLSLPVDAYGLERRAAQTNAEEPHTKQAVKLAQIAKSRARIKR
jgi:glycine oxidase